MISAKYIGPYFQQQVFLEIVVKIGFLKCKSFPDDINDVIGYFE